MFELVEACAGLAISIGSDHIDDYGAGKNRYVILAVVNVDTICVCQ